MQTIVKMSNFSPRIKNHQPVQLFFKVDYGSTVHYTKYIIDSLRNSRYTYNKVLLVG